ncbi:YidH family protein [Blastococcus sp. VKM Ac-2987]|uniref:YidH family protein n=1 Tax=Blastococcus sp. VKM Ac-2987 TaxID=3004141 RepID=UPI002F26D7DE
MIAERLSRRYPRRVYTIGEEPDPRFSLANERTFLAWMRTSLAFLAAGVALEALDLPIAEGLRLASALVFIALGLLAPVQAWFGWMATERALRRSRPLPSPRLGLVTAVGAGVSGMLVLIGLLLR